jgi:hypothetical protein
MSPKRRDPARASTLRELAQARVASKPPADLDALTPREIRDLVHELEVHKVELQIQNEQRVLTSLRVLGR